MRIVVTLLAALSLLSCRPAPDTPSVSADVTLERIANAIAGRPLSRRPCESKRCGIVPRAAVIAARDSTYLERCIASDSLIRRWPVRVGEPVLVWIAPLPRRIPNRGDERLRVRRAFRVWERAGVPVRFTFVRDSASAEVRVRWTDQLTEQRAGIIRRRTDEQNWMRSGDILLALRNERGQRYPGPTFQGVAAHEVGHVLGLEHSDDPADVMAPVVGTSEPGTRDRATVRALYSNSAGRVR